MPLPHSGSVSSLLDELSAEKLETVLPAPGQWRPVPQITDREFWRAADPLTRQWAVGRAEAALEHEWPAMSATSFGAFLRTGDRSGYEGPYFQRRARLANAVLAACMTNEERFLDDVIDGLWTLCEETTWCLPAHDLYALRAGSPLPLRSRHFVDLFAAETAATLAWTLAVLGPRLADRAGAALADRVIEQIRSQVLRPYVEENEWHWERKAMNWNPWIHSNLIAASLLVEPELEPRTRLLQRAIIGLDAFWAGYPDDGGCDEGASYWWVAGGCFILSLDLLYMASGANLNLFQLPKLAGIARYPLAMHVGDDWYATVADGQPRFDHRGIRASGAAAPFLLFRIGQRLADNELTMHGRAMRRPGEPAATSGSLGLRLLALADPDWTAAPQTEYPYPQQAWYETTQVLMARSRRGTNEGLSVVVKGGHNDESHNHNDVGSFMVALDGRLALIDVGVGEYTRRTFGPERYSIWTMSSSYHNTPEINGIPQEAGPHRAASEVSVGSADHSVSMGLDLAGAYPPAAGITTLHRTVTLDRSRDVVEVADRWELRQEPQSIVFRLMTADPVTVDDNICQIAGSNRPLLVECCASAFDIEVEELALNDTRLRWTWGPRIHRVTLSVRAPGRRGESLLRIRPGTYA